MKRKRLLAALAAALLLLTACGGEATEDYNGNSGAFNDSMSESYGGWGGDTGADYDAPQDAQESAPESAPAVPAGNKIIYTADMELETKEFDSAVQALDDIVTGLGGWFESRTVNQGGGYRRLSCTVRVPAERFTELLDQAGQAAHMTYRQEYQEDVSESYYDTDARLTTQRTKLERLQTLLSQAESMEDIITLESAISDTELQIEYLTGSLRRYDSLIGYSTVTIMLQEVYRLSTDEEPAVTFSQRLGAAFTAGLRRGGEAAEGFVLFVAGNWITLLVLAAAAAAAVGMIRRQRRRKRNGTQPPAPPAPPTKE